MIVLGIDPGTATTGFGVVQSNGHDHKLIEAGVIRTPAKQAMELRLETIYDDVSEIIKQYKPDHVSVEQLFFAKNVTNAMTVAQARGVVLLAIIKAGLDHSEFTPMQIKQAVTGYGHADKNQIQQMVKVMLKLKTTPKPDDAADALAAALCYLGTVSSRS